MPLSMFSASILSKQVHMYYFKKLFFNSTKHSYKKKQQMNNFSTINIKNLSWKHLPLRITNLMGI